MNAITWACVTTLGNRYQVETHTVMCNSGGVVTEHTETHMTGSTQPCVTQYTMSATGRRAKPRANRARPQPATDQDTPTTY